MQGILLLGVFLKVVPYPERMGLAEDGMLAKMRAVLSKYFGKRGEQVVKENLECVRRGYDEIGQVPAEWVKS
jgi:pyruvate-ferredoxin/flavodoxin oxidoreductase